MEDKIKQTECEKEDAIKLQDFERAAKLRDEEELLRQKYRESTQNSNDEIHTYIGTADDVADIVTEWTGIPVKNLQSEENNNLSNLENSLKEKIKGQDDAIHSISQAIKRGRTGLKEADRPIGTFLLMGPTGVGKTELAKALSISLFGSKDALIRIDMSEYMEKHTLSRLIGSPPGYVGYGEPGQLTEKVRRKPYSVLLFDEIEKAHPDIHNLLLQILDDGVLTDAHGISVNFKNTIIIMTSNVGASDVYGKQRLGFSTLSDEKIESKASLMPILKSTFPPEFINRLDEVIIFKPLSPENIYDITASMVKKLEQRTELLGIKLEFTEECIKFIADRGYSKIYGARELRRTLIQLAENLLAEKILAGDIKAGNSIVAKIKDDKVVYENKNI